MAPSLSPAGLPPKPKWKHEIDAWFKASVDYWRQTRLAPEMTARDVQEACERALLTEDEFQELTKLVRGEPV
jgi:hypothetical protein